MWFSIDGSAAGTQGAPHPLPNAGVGRLPTTVRVTRRGSGNERVRIDLFNDCPFGERHVSRGLRHNVVREEDVTPELIGAGCSAKRGPFIISSDLFCVGELRWVFSWRRWWARFAAGDPYEAEVAARKDR